jgi:pimeloyl-ACP methyl ester carboxylesterase
MVVRASITRVTNWRSLLWPTSSRSHTSIIVVMAVARETILRLGIWPQWGDDLKTFCDVLAIEKPVVYGASFGGMVALAYATRHPNHPAKLILVSTEAASHSHLEQRVALFERLGGSEVGAYYATGPVSTSQTSPSPARWSGHRSSTSFIFKVTGSRG